MAAATATPQGDFRGTGCDRQTLQGDHSGDGDRTTNGLRNTTKEILRPAPPYESGSIV